MIALWQRVIAQVSMAFDKLSNQNRKIVLISVPIIVFVMIFGGFFWTKWRFDQKRSAGQQVQQQIAEMLSLKNTYEQAKMNHEQELHKIRSNSVALFSHLQTQAARLGIKLYDLDEQKRTIGETDMVQETAVTNVKELSIDKLTAFIEAIEDSVDNRLVKVTRLKVKRRYDNPELLDVQMSVSTWKSG